MDFSRGDWNTGRLGIDNVKNVRHSKERKEMCEAFITHPYHGLTTPPIHPLAIYIYVWNSDFLASIVVFVSSI
jgi:hypothetical protein